MVFSILGEMKRVLNVDDIQVVVKQKQGLAFVAYPEVISLLGVPQLWSGKENPNLMTSAKARFF